MDKLNLIAMIMYYIGAGLFIIPGLLTGDTMNFNVLFGFIGGVLVISGLNLYSPFKINNLNDWAKWTEGAEPYENKG